MFCSSSEFTPYGLTAYCLPDVGIWVDSANAKALLKMNSFDLRLSYDLPSPLPPSCPPPPVFVSLSLSFCLPSFFPSSQHLLEPKLGEMYYVLEDVLELLILPPSTLEC